MKKTSKSFMGLTDGIISPRPNYEDGKRQLDWDKAKEFIELNKEEISYVEAGLAEDWGYTSDIVWSSSRGYIPKDETSVYASSSWATPAIEVQFNNGDEEVLECWKFGNNPDSYFKDK